MKLQYFSGFAGIGGFDRGIEKAIPDAINVGFSEVDKYAIKIYEKHFPDRINYGDIRRIDTRALPDFDMFCGGFPCQDLSIAGKRAGLCGARSGLFFEIIRIIREKQPRLVFLENVKGLFNSNNGWDFARILLELDESGYDVEWQCLNSKNFGVPQNRERVFIIGHLGGEPKQKIFPIGENDKIFVTPDRAERRQPQTPISTTLSGKCRASDTFIRCLTGGGHSGGAHSSMTMICVDGNGRIDDRITGTLTNRYYKGCESYGSSPFILNVPHGFNNGFKKPYPNLRAEGDSAHNELLISPDKAIRRLTPLECERLQGYPDGWTAGISDSQRYKCLGNTVTVNVIEAIAKRLA